MPLRPTDNDVVEAVTTAARLVDPQNVLTATMAVQRARAIVVTAMREAFPKLSVREVGRHIGLSPRELEGLHSTISAARAAKWWDERHVDEIVGLLVAPYYGKRAS